MAVSEPVNVAENPRARTLEVVGPFAAVPGSGLVFRAAPDKLEWLVVPEVAPEVPPAEPPLFGNFEERLSAFKAALAGWCGSLGSRNVSRVAFGAQLLRLFESRSQAFDDLADLLRDYVKVEDSGVSDFTYVVNRPRPLQSWPGHNANRLSKWQMSEWRLMQLSTGLLGQSIFCAGLELDVNTAVASTGEELPNLAGTFVELTDLALEISQRGDTR